MQDLRVSRRRILKAVGASAVLGIALGPEAVLAEDENNRKVSWDLINLDFTNNHVTAGGHASAFANDGSKITITGSGTFRANSGDPEDVSGGGTWETSGGSGRGGEWHLPGHQTGDLHAGAGHAATRSRPDRPRTRAGWPGDSPRPLLARNGRRPYRRLSSGGHAQFSLRGNHGLDGL